MNALCVGSARCVTSTTSKPERLRDVFAPVAAAFARGHDEWLLGRFSLMALD